MVQEQIAPQTSGSGLPIDLNDPTVNRRRERRIYYRPHYGKDNEFIGYFPTLPLPSDPYHMNYYVNKKGFKLWPPGNEPGQEEIDSMRATLTELEAQVAATKEATAETEAAKAEAEAEVKRLNEQAATLRDAIESVKIEVNDNAITCPVEGCAKIVKSYIGLARHMAKVHGIK